MLQRPKHLESYKANAMNLGGHVGHDSPERDVRIGGPLPARGRFLSSLSPSLALAAVVALVASIACNRSPMEGGVEWVRPAEAHPIPSAKPAEPSSAPVSATNSDVTYEPAVLTIIAIDIETRLAFMCGLPRSKVFFKYNSAKLLSGAKEILERIATCAKTGPAKGKALLVVGRTDPLGSDKDNKKLGMSRAESVAKYLSKLGVAQARVEMVSKGEAAADEAFPGNWPTDRRVTLRLQPSAGLAAPQERRKMTDLQITDAVVHTLFYDSMFLNQQIEAHVNKGIVTLSGTADYLLAKERAAKLAQTIRGVRGVVNTIALKIPSRSDDQLRNDVKLALLFDAATDSYGFIPAVKDGVVTLSGTSPSYLEKRLAVHVAKGVKGVKEVKDNMTLKITRDRRDSEIATEVKRAIAINVWLDRSFVATVVKDGVVTLTGVVGSSAQHALASLLAWTAGVKSVNAKGLWIESWANPSGRRRKKIATRGDPRLKKAVQDSFVYDPRVLSFNPIVAVEKGVVTLTGVVDNLKAKHAAGQDAMNTVGVWQVKNLLTVHPAKPVADDVLARNVTAAFQRDPIIGSFEISVKAMKGVVTLTGSVSSTYAEMQAVDTASRARGVVNVTNKLTVHYPTLAYYDVGYDPLWAFHAPIYSAWSANPRNRSWPRISDAALKSAVEGELFWSPFVDRFLVTVKAEQGVVTLTGTVDSWSELRAATNKAYEGGALKVRNELKVR